MKYIVYYNHHKPHMDVDFENLIDEPAMADSSICVIADSADEAAEMVKNNIKYSYTDYDEIIKVKAETDFDDTDKSWINMGVARLANPDGNKNWELDRRQRMF